MQSLKVWARWRPLSSGERETGEIERECNKQDPDASSLSSISIFAPFQSNKQTSSRDSSWKSGESFTGVFEASHNNKDVFDCVVKPILPEVLQGKACNFFAYGHSGSGKSHTMIGYDFEHSDEYGLCLAAARHLGDALNAINNEADGRTQFGLGMRMYELRKSSAFDLLNDRCECFIREGADGRVYIRGETEMLDDGKVRVRPIVTKACWSFEDLRRELLAGLSHRKIGSSSVHDQSSRTHAVLELEIVTTELLEARDAVVERQSELVPVGKYATDVYIEEQTRAIIQTPDGKFVPNPDYQINQERVNAAEARKAEFESRVKEAEEHETKVFKAMAQKHPCIGGKLVFVDLAGAEYYDTKNGAVGPKQTPQEKQEGRQINSDLLALKEVIRARATNQSRIPYRSSRLTMVLRPHFQGSVDSHSAMILTVSPSVGQFAATMNTLKYGDLVGLARGSKR